MLLRCRAAAILGRKARGLLAHDETLAELADADCADALAAVIAERMRLRQELVTRALEAESDEVISVMCAAAGFPINSYSALLRMRRRRHLGAATAPTEALTFFSSLTRNQIVSAALTLMGMLILLGFYLAEFVLRGAGNLEVSVKAVMRALSFIDMWIQAAGGKLYVRDVAVQLSLAVFWIFATVKVLEARRWS